MSMYYIKLSINGFHIFEYIFGLFSYTVNDVFNKNIFYSVCHFSKLPLIKRYYLSGNSLLISLNIFTNDGGIF